MGQVPRFLKPESCVGCSLHTAGFGFAPPSGPPGAALTFIGEALGYEEAIAGEPFYGSAGGVLSRILHRCGIQRAHVRIGNVVSCRPPNDYLSGAPWEHHAIASCRQFLQPLLDSVPPNGVVVTLGAVPLGAVLGMAGQKGVTVKDFHGTVHRIDRADGTGYWVVCTFHPSHLQRGAMNLLEIVCNDIRLAERISRDGFVRSESELIIDPSPEWFTWWTQNHLAMVNANPEGTHLSLDTEFPEKSPGVDESEVLDWNAQSPMTRINGGNDRKTGWTVPAREPYLGIFRAFMRQLNDLGAWAWFWNKYSELDHFVAAEIPCNNLMAIDGMWLWKHIQSDVPRGLGFVAPLASDFGAWKHWANTPEKEGAYAAADGVQNWRTNMWLMKSAMTHGLWDVFMRDWHDRDQYCLRPAHVMGVPIDRPGLQVFHQELQTKLGTILSKIKDTAAKGVLKPKEGYPKPPMQKCTKCHGAGELPGWPDESVREQCDACWGAGKTIATAPPASVLGKPKKGGGEAKQQYMSEGVILVEAEVEIDVRCCDTCKTQDVGPRHKCKRPPKPKAVRSPRRSRKRAQPAVLIDADAGRDVAAPPVEEPAAPPVTPDPVADRSQPAAVLSYQRLVRRRWYWQLPFNPDAPAQVLAYLEQQGIEAPYDKKKQRKTTAKKALADLQKKYRDDPFFQLQLDWKAVQKVDSVYAVGTLAILDKNDRVHPEYLPIPSTLRDSARHPNLTNVVADKSGVQGLAAGFRRVVVAREGVPEGVTEDELRAWEARWAN